MTQTEHDNKVSALRLRGISIYNNVADLRKQGDPAARKIEEECMLLENVLDALEGYTLTDDVLEDDDITFFFELAELAVTKSHSIRIPVSHVITDFDDWYLPSVGDLIFMADNLHANGLGGFVSAEYSSSHEYAADTMVTIDMAAGSTTRVKDKNLSFRVRSCREFISDNNYEFGDPGQAGGLIFNKVDNLDGTYTYYEAASEDISTSHAWSNIIDSLAGTSYEAGTGAANSALIVAQIGHTTSAAKICLDQEVDI